MSSILTNDSIGMTGGPAANLVFSTSINGLAPVSPGGTTLFLRADGAWASTASSGMPNPMTTLGDTIYGASGGTPARLAAGLNTYILTMVAGLPAWSAPSSGLVNPMTTTGDMIVGGAAGVPARLAKGIDGQVLTLVTGAEAWVTPASGWSFWDPDKLPGSPSAYDDEFEATTLDAKWTTINWGFPTIKDVNTTVPGCLYMKLPNNSNTRICILQAIPAGDFSIFIKGASASTITGANGGVSMILSTTNTSGSGTQAMLDWGTTGSGQYVETYTWSGFSALDGALLNGAVYGRQARYFRMTRFGTVYGFYWSEDGKTWAGGTASLAVVPLYFGVGGFSGGGEDMNISIEFFRYFGSSTSRLGGQRP